MLTMLLLEVPNQTAQPYLADVNRCSLFRDLHMHTALNCAKERHWPEADACNAYQRSGLRLYRYSSHEPYDNESTTTTAQVLAVTT